MFARAALFARMEQTLFNIETMGRSPGADSAMASHQ